VKAFFRIGRIPPNLLESLVKPLNQMAEKLEDKNTILLA